MIRSAFLIGRILAALGAVLAVATLVLIVVSLAVTDPCEMPDCDDSGRDYPVLWAVTLAPLSVVMGAFGVALINDTYRKSGQSLGSRE